MKKTMIINNKLGLHTRAALQIVELARQAKYGVWLSKDDQRADASSTIELLTLYCPQGSEITVGIDHSHDHDILKKIISRIENKFGEE